MYHPVGAHERDVSTRLIRPTLPNMLIDKILDLVHNWNASWGIDGSILIYDEGIAQYMLANEASHEKFYAALIKGISSLRCRLIEEEPDDILDQDANNFISAVNESGRKLSERDSDMIEKLKCVLSRRGYRFDN